MPKARTSKITALLAGAFLASCASPPPAPDPVLRAAALARTREAEDAFSAGRYDEACLRYGEALAVHRSIGSAEGMARCLVNLATVRLAASDAPGARDYLDAMDRCLATVRVSNPVELDRGDLPDLRARAACLRARLEADAGHIEAAWKALGTEAPGSAKPETLALRRLLEARLHLRQSNNASSLEAARQALKLCRKAGDRPGEADAHRYAARALLRSGQPAAALDEFSAALALDQDLARPPKVAADLGGMAEAARATGDETRARACEKRQSEVREAAAPTQDEEGGAATARE